MKRFRKSAIALVLALLMALQGTEPIFVQAKEAIEDVQKNADFSRPEALTEEEAGITDSTSGEQDKSQQSDADVQNETTPSEDTETQEEQTTPAEETEENPQEKEVELKEPQDYYPIPEEPEGELIDYDAISKTYKTGDKQYTTVYGGYVGTYKNEDGDTELVDNTLVKPEEADTPASEEAQEASSVVATEEKEEKTEVYQNKANDYAILLPEQMSEENGVTIENGKTRIGIIPVDGDYTHSVIKDNAILYNEVYEGADVQYTVLDSSIKEDIVLQQPTDREVYEYELQIPGYQAEVKDNQVYIYPEGKTIKDAKYLLETPSMEDAAGEISFLITLELREEDGKTILTVKPDRDWLSAEERQYPVRIDPTPVEIQKSSFNMIGVEEGSPTSQIGDNNYPYVGFDDGIKSGNLAGFGTAHQNCRTYIKVNSNFSQIPKDSKIDSATFAVSQKTAYSGGASQFGLYRVDQSWNTSITWKTKPVNLTFQDVQNASTSRNSYINYDVKDLVNDWVQGTHANNGFALVAIAEANNLGASMQCEVLNNRASVYGPKLSIQWSPAEDPYLRDMSLDETTILLRPMTEKNTNGKLKFDAVFADGIAKSKSTVEYYLLPDEENGNATVSKFDSLGQVLQSKDAVGNITKYEYDALGNETKITYGDGSSHSKEYDNCGRLAKETDELGAVTTYTYDAADNLVSKSDDSGRTWTYTYDNTGNRLSETNPEGGTTTYTYDKAGNLVSSTDEEGRTDTYAYDKAGNLTTSKDALGYTVSMKYDLNGNLVSSTDENGNTSTMTYDGNGNMTSVSDAKGNITAMKYDSTDNLEQTVDNKMEEMCADTSFHR